MLEYSTTDVAVLRREASSHSGDNEVFLRDDGDGAVIISENETKGEDHSTAHVLKKLFDGGRFGRDGGDWLFCVGLWTPGDFREEFLAWYQIEHLPMLLECPTWDGCRFVEESVHSGCQFFAMHQLSDKQALDSDARRRSRATPWFKRLAKNDWFDGAFVRVLYRRMP